MSQVRSSGDLDVCGSVNYSDFRVGDLWGPSPTRHKTPLEPAYYSVSPREAARESIHDGLLEYTFRLSRINADETVSPPASIGGSNR